MKKIMYMGLIILAAAGCNKNNQGGNFKTDVVYLETNDFNDNKNAILAYYNINGTLEPVPGSPFYSGGAGVANPTQALGPDDSDTQLKLSEDGQFLLAVNPGSNSIAVFRIHENGSLSPVPGSPFTSGGETPSSIDIHGKYVYVVNKSDNPLHPSNQNPNYTTFTLDNEGRLSQIQGAKFETAPGSSPSQALISNNRKFVFSADFLGFMLTPVQGTLRSFSTTTSGKLEPVSGTPYTIPGKGGALGLWQHPNSAILYVGFPLQAKVGIYAIDENSGALTFQSTIDAGAAACWLRTTKNGNYLYALNSGENTISQFNSSNASAPSSLGKFALAQPGPNYTAMGLTFTSSEDFGLAFSTDEKSLYVISQSTNPDFAIGNFNYLHVLGIDNNGILTEPTAPLQLPVDSHLRPQGIVVIKASLPAIQGKS